ncbi:MAG TPA: hypothetical protein DIC52_17975 [Candidatus Latescibacteria bacterium]|nr:hypothetical protein [Candidatus Latescibacterota bacterium]
MFELQQFHTIAPTPGSIVSKPRLFGSYLNRLVIADDSYKGTDSRFMIGDRIRTKFTSLTLDMAAMNGVRMDNRSEHVSLIMVASRVDRPIFESAGDRDQLFHGSIFATNRPRLATWLLGSDLRTKWPGLDVGVSWVNQFRTDTFNDIGETSIKGVLPVTNSPPEFLVVRVADQDPDDNAGVRVRRAVVVLNGVEIVHTPGPYDRLSETLTVTVTEHTDRTIIPPLWTSANGLVVDHPHVDPTPQGYYETRGEGSLLFWFRVPAYLREGPDSLVVNQARVDLDVAGDYVVELSEIYGVTQATNNPATYFYTAAQARGRPSDLNDFRRVRVRYGRQTANTLASVHANLDIKGYLFHAEYVRNFNHRAYPALTGHRGGRFESQSPAWYVVGRRAWDRLSVGGELFDMAEDYSTTLSVQDPAYSSWVDAFGGNFKRYEPRLPARIGNKLADATYTLEFSSVDDNDDKDQYPDIYFLKRPAPNGRYIVDPDGIFPGLDADLNGRPDINENVNRVPDYFEPFLLYKVSPDAYEYGEDMNNNAVIDVREDDQKPDYPYDPDRQGGHLFGLYKLRKGMAVTAGYHKTEASFAGTRSEMAYGRFEYERRLPFLVDLFAVERLKRVRDDIRDDVFGVARNPIYFEPDIIPLNFLSQEELLNPLGQAVLLRDPLLMRHSWVNTAFVRAGYIQVPQLTAEVTLKYDSNFQQSTAFQLDNRISDLAMVVRADYKWRPWKELRVIPQLKWLRQRLKDDEQQVLAINESYFYPILKLEYPISSRTVAKLGAQGFPFLKSTYRSKTAPRTDFDSEVYVAMVSNTSSYVGYQINVNAGFERRTRKFLDVSRRDQDIDYSRIFLRAIAGLQPSF